MYAPPLAGELVPLLERTMLSENREESLIFDQNRATPAPRAVYKLHWTTPIAVVIQITNKGSRGSQHAL